MTLTRSQARDYIAGQPSLILQPDRHGGYICPICGSGNGTHGTGLFVERDKQHFTCFAGGCFKNKSIFDIIGLQYGLTDFRDMMNKAAELAGIELVSDGRGSYGTSSRSERSAPAQTDRTGIKEPPPVAEAQSREQSTHDYTKAFHVWHSCIDQTDYWKRRGLTRKITSRFKIGYNPKYKIYGKNGEIAALWKALIIPVTRHAFAIRNTDTAAPSEERHRKVGSGKTLYNPLKIDFSSPETPFFVVEGELDALSLIQSGGAAVALRSVTNADTFIEKCLNKQPESPCYILGLLDTDEKGRAANSMIEETLKGSNFLFEGFNISPFHDPNDWLVKDPKSLESFVQVVMRTTKRLMKEKGASGNDD